MADRDVREQGNPAIAGGPAPEPVSPTLSAGVQALRQIQGTNDEVFGFVSDTLRRFYGDPAELHAMLLELQQTRGNDFTLTVVNQVQQQQPPATAAEVASSQRVIANMHKVDPEGAGPDGNGLAIRKLDPDNPMVGATTAFHDGPAYGYALGEMSPDHSAYRAQFRGGYELAPQTFAYGGLELRHQDGLGTQTTLDAGFDHGTPDQAHSIHGTFSTGPYGTQGTLATDSTLRLSGTWLYGRVLSSVQADDDAHIQFGAGLTLTRREGQALTAIGLMDNNGGLDLRVQLDIMRGRIDGASDLADWKKSALMSLIVGYRTQLAPDNLLNSELGQPQLGAGDTGFYGGVRFSF